MTIDSIYTSLGDAANMLSCRLSTRDQFSDDPIARLFSAQPHAVLFRQVATPNYESERFVTLAKAHGLQPLFLEFHSDRFCTYNSLKCALARMRFSCGPEGDQASPSQIRRVVDMAAVEGCRFKDMTTLWGQSFVAFHHDLLRGVSAFSEVATIDGSQWFRAHGRHADKYYACFLTLFRNAILFDDFLLSSKERKFTEDVVVPAFDDATIRLGMRPLISRIASPLTAEHSTWFDYPPTILPQLDAISPSPSRNSRKGESIRERLRLHIAECSFGLGVFTRQPVAAGQIIMRLSGRPLTQAEASEDPDEAFNHLQIAPRLYLQLDPPGIYVNHSCDPNCGITSDLLLIALRDIHAGEQLFYDYSTTMLDSSSMECHCGSSHCRGIVRDFPELPFIRQQYYLAQKVVLSFIAESFRSQAV